MKEVTIKSDPQGHYDLYIDGVIVKDACGINITYNVDMKYPEVNVQYAMFNSDYNNVTKEELSMLESELFSTIMNKGKSK